VGAPRRFGAARVIGAGRLEGNPMIGRHLFAVAGLGCAASFGGAADDKPLTPAEARKKVGEKVMVEMEVKAAKDRLEKRGEIYLDAEEDFKDERNFAVVITKTGAASLKDAGVTDPAGHFKGKTIRAAGTVKEVDGVPRIEIDKADQIKLGGK
jgi:DNA/RNA endonuclease YhcR with UshA esterase domain